MLISKLEAKSKTGAGHELLDLQVHYQWTFPPARSYFPSLPKQPTNWGSNIKYMSLWSDSHSNQHKYFCMFFLLYNLCINLIKLFKKVKNICSLHVLLPRIGPQNNTEQKQLRKDTCLVSDCKGKVSTVYW